MKKKPRCVILGGGGHASVLVDCLQLSDQVDLVGFLDPDSLIWGDEIQGVPILGGDELLPKMIDQGVTHFAVGVGSIGDSAPRRRLFELGTQLDLKPLQVVHPTASLSPRASLGMGVQLLPGSVINSGASLGICVIANSGALIEHDCIIRDYVHVATGACIAGNVLIDREAHIGAGATVIESISIGEGAIIGAGAVVVDDVQPHTVVLGVPARFYRNVE